MELPFREDMPRSLESGMGNNNSWPAAASHGTGVAGYDGTSWMPEQLPWSWHLDTTVEPVAHSPLGGWSPPAPTAEWPVSDPLAATMDSVAPCGAQRGPTDPYRPTWRHFDEFACSIRGSKVAGTCGSYI